MDLTGHVTQVHQQLAASAALADERTREIAEALAGAATPALRLAIMTALAAAAEEITAALLDSPGAPMVTVRLDGDEVRIDVADTEAQPVTTPPRTDDGESSARISLRLPETLKAGVEAAANREGLSVNTWLVRAANTALGTAAHATGIGRAKNTHRITGWING